MMNCPDCQHEHPYQICGRCDCLGPVGVGVAGLYQALGGLIIILVGMHRESAVQIKGYVDQVILAYRDRQAGAFRGTGTVEP